MYKTNKQLRQTARQALSGKWGSAVFMLILSGLLTLVISYLPVIGYASSFFTAILNVGFFSFLLKLCCNQKSGAKISDLFYGFQCYPSKALLLYLYTILYTLPGSIIYAVLAALFLFVSFSGMDSTYINPIALVCFILVFLVLTLLFMAYAFYIDATYGMVYFLLLDYPDLLVHDIWRRSKQLMTGHRKQYVLLQLSFIWPLILPAVLFGAALVYVLSFYDHHTSPLVLVLLIVSSLLFAALSVWLKIWSHTANAAMYLDLIQKQSMTAAANTAGQVYTGEHSNQQHTNGTDYSGIDSDTFQ